VWISVIEEDRAAAVRPTKHPESINHWASVIRPSLPEALPYGMNGEFE